ncbi:hypothetical protein [Bradyrhizobium sp. LMG 9283]|uniref:hypothetical protein n=1 Tax=Bradyrhizobium sp. LMG 9283 TaxID=592064 RepID=UPI003890E4CC
MDMREASAMTEASGLIDDSGAIGTPQPNDQTKSTGTRRSLRQPSNEAALRWAERLRKVTVQAPLLLIPMISPGCTDLISPRIPR